MSRPRVVCAGCTSADVTDPFVGWPSGAANREDGAQRHAWATGQPSCPTGAGCGQTATPRYGAAMPNLCASRSSDPGPWAATTRASSPPVARTELAAVIDPHEESGRAVAEQYGSTWQPDLDGIERATTRSSSRQRPRPTASSPAGPRSGPAPAHREAGVPVARPDHELRRHLGSGRHAAHVRLPRALQPGRHRGAQDDRDAALRARRPPLAVRPPHQDRRGMGPPGARRRPDRPCLRRRAARLDERQGRSLPPLVHRRRRGRRRRSRPVRRRWRRIGIGEPARPAQSPLDARPDARPHGRDRPAASRTHATGTPPSTTTPAWASVS